MNLKMKKAIAWVLVCLCVFGSMPKEMVKATSSNYDLFCARRGGRGGIRTILMKHYRVVHHVVERLFWKMMYIMISRILFIMIQ